jgi:hypothetical protein
LSIAIIGTFHNPIINNKSCIAQFGLAKVKKEGYIAHFGLTIGHSEPAPTRAPSTICPLLLSCG